jgi:hypothetical protein
MKTSIPRLSRVTFKDGRQLHVLRNTRSERCAREFREDCAKIATKRGDLMAGYAIVAWERDGGVTTVLNIHDGRPVGPLMAPDFVRTALIDFIASET